MTQTRGASTLEPEVYLAFILKKLMVMSHALVGASLYNSVHLRNSKFTIIKAGIERV